MHEKKVSSILYSDAEYLLNISTDTLRLLVFTHRYKQWMEHCQLVNVIIIIISSSSTNVNI